MKTITRILFLASLVVAFSCQREEDNIFEKSSTQRINEAVKEYTTILTTPENGWKMSYFPQTSQKFGGYVFLLKFDDKGNVTVASEIFDSDDTATSLYQVNQNAGVTLCFDTYNEIFTSFSDPSAPLAGDTGYGMEGDNDFLIVEASKDRVVLKGKKSGSYSVLEPMKSADWAGYLKSFQTKADDMTYTAFVLTGPDKSIKVSGSYRKMYFTCTDEAGESYEESSAYIFTDDGLKMYTPVEVEGLLLDEFKYDAKALKFVSTENPSIVITPYIAPIAETFMNGSWCIRYANLTGSFTKSCFDAGDAAFYKNTGLSLMYAYLCKGDDLISGYNSNWGFTTYTGQYAGGNGINVTKVADNKVSMVYDSTKNQGNGDTFASLGFTYYLNAFSNGTNPRTFTITTDNVKSPSWVRLVEDGNPDNDFTLYDEFETYK